MTNPVRVARGINEKAANAVLIKLNQIGTVTESIETIGKRAAQSAHRSIIWPESRTRPSLAKL